MRAPFDTCISQCAAAYACSSRWRSRSPAMAREASCAADDVAIDVLRAALLAATLSLRVLLAWSSSSASGAMATPFAPPRAAALLLGSAAAAASSSYPLLSSSMPAAFVFGFFLGAATAKEPAAAAFSSRADRSSSSNTSFAATSCAPSSAIDTCACLFASSSWCVCATAADRSPVSLWSRASYCAIAMSRLNLCESMPDLMFTSSRSRSSSFSSSAARRANPDCCSSRRDSSCLDMDPRRSSSPWIALPLTAPAAAPARDAAASFAIKRSRLVSSSFLATSRTRSWSHECSRAEPFVACAANSCCRSE